MSRFEKSSTMLIRGVITTAILAIVAAIVIQWAESSREKLPVLGDVPYFKLNTSSGNEFTREDLNGRVHVFDFIFTRCQGVCPVMAKAFGEMYRLYEGSDKVRLVSVTVDPDYDSQEILQQYASAQGVTDGRWLFGRGALVDVAALIEKGFMLDAGSLPEGHPSKLILVDSEGKIRGYYSSDSDSDLELLKQHIRQLARAL